MSWRVTFLVWSIALMCSRGATAESSYDDLSYERFIKLDENSKTSDGALRESLPFLKLVMDDPLQTAENRYLAARLYGATLGSYHDAEETKITCERHPPLSDDFLYLATCAWYQDGDPDKKVQAIEAIAEEAWQLKGKQETAHTIYNSLADWLNSSGRILEGIRQYKNAFAAVPPGDDMALIYAKENLAVAYANPLLGSKLEHLSVQYYQEIIDTLSKKPKSPVVQENIGHVSFNKGIAELFLFKNYQTAVNDFTRALGQEYLDQDARIFLAYTYAQLGDKQRAGYYRQGIDFATVLDPTRRDFLSCYFNLSKTLLREPASLESCLAIEIFQTDVMFNLTEVLQGMKLPASDENRMWRRFYRFFVQRILPDLQNSVDSVSNQVELEKERAENRLNALKLQNLSLYQRLSWTLAMLTGILILAAYLAIRSWRNGRRYNASMQKEKHRLQHILESIDEGIFSIDSQLFMMPERSSHLTAIVGEGNWEQTRLLDFLHRFRLSEDQRDLIVACLQASFQEDPLAWELNSPNLPRELPLGDRTIAFFWEPVFVHERLTSVFLVLRNVTAARQLEKEKELALRSADQQLVLAREILSGHPQAALEFLRQAPKTLARLTLLIKDPSGNTDVLRLMHTLKGTARTLGLTQLQNLSHDFETAWQAQDPAIINGLLRDLQESVAAYEKTVNGIVDQVLTRGPTDLLEMVSLHRKAVERQLTAAGLSLAEVRVREATPIPKEALGELQEILVHGLSNAVDHGFVRPRARGLPVGPAKFDITLRCEGPSLRFEILDNGAGIDLETLRELARQRSWQAAPGQSLTDILFESGISTAGHVSQTSGRGVGLTAIQASAGKLGGRARIDRGPEGGTLLSVEWPLAQQDAA